MITPPRPLDLGSSYLLFGPVASLHPIRESTGMSAADIVARLRRLDALSRGLSLELYNVSKADGPMLYVERREHHAAMRRVLNGFESARVVPAKAKQRMDGIMSR
jgi:hypothetical protein